MKKVEPINVGVLLDDFFAKRQLSAAIIQGKAVELWRDIVGDYVAQYTEDVYIRSGVLYVSISSASVRSEVYIRRRFFADQINSRLKTKAVRNIVVR